MKKWLLLLMIVPLISNASFPIEQSNPKIPVSDSFLIEQSNAETPFIPYEFCNNFANISFYFGIFWFLLAITGSSLRYASSEKMLGEILMVFASIYSVVAFTSGVAGLFTGEKRWQSIFGILLSVPGLIFTWFLIKYGFDFYE